MPTKINVRQKNKIKKPASQPGKARKASPKEKGIKTKRAKESKPQPLSSTGKDKTVFPIVGIGASAGGLNAFENFFKHMPSDAGIAFVLVSHLDPKHVSIMPELIQKHTKMQVLSVEDGVEVQPNAIYVIPPNKFIAILHGTLYLMEPTSNHGSRLPIDAFFRSLAKDQGSNAIGIILSGTGTDGTLGLKEIRGAGGMVMVQDPQVAAYDGMPRSAVATGMVDFILPPEKMPGQLLTYLKHSTIRQVVTATSLSGKMPEALQKVFILLRSHTGYDLSLYKQSTICRRIERRMNVNQIDTIANYVRYLEENPDEVKILFKELLIGVTNFFRDPGAFEVLEKKVLPELLRGKPKDYCLRAWVPGCSSGEEAYSLAIILREYMNVHKHYFKVQIFGTDIDSDAIGTARGGVYPGSIISDVTPARLKQFFLHEDAFYRVRKEIREMVIFAVQNVINDPPFTKMDLICCRNLLIYLGPELQRKVIPLFHYSLNPQGILFLGTSESIGQFLNLFTVIDNKSKVFQSRGSAFASRTLVTFPLTSHEYDSTVKESSPDVGETIKASTSKMFEKILLENYTPACVIINEKSEVLYIHGRTGKYLEPASGEPNFNLLHMARQGLGVKLSNAIRKAVNDKQEAHAHNIQVKDNGGFQTVNVTVTPIKEPALSGLFLVVFEPASPAAQTIQKKTKRVARIKEDKRIEELEEELLHTRESLQIAMQEMDSFNEELKSANEELQSTNEELQSTNEETETSKEELQSLNEELVTVNAELEGRINELSKVNDDLKNLLETTSTATIFLDTGLCVTLFTPQATEIINLINTDIGRPIKDIVSNLQYEHLVHDADEVLTTLVRMEKEVVNDKGCWYNMRISPYRTLDNVIGGVVITFDEITGLKHIQQQALERQQYAESIFETIREPLLVLDSQMKIVSANRSFYRIFKVTPRKTIDKNFFSLGKGQWSIPALKNLLEEILPREKAFIDYEVTYDFPKIGKKTMRLNGRELCQQGSQKRLILLALEEIK